MLKVVNRYFILWSILTMNIAFSQIAQSDKCPLWIKSHPYQDINQRLVESLSPVYEIMGEFQDMPPAFYGEYILMMNDIFFDFDDFICSIDYKVLAAGSYNSPNDFIEVIAPVHENYFTDDEATCKKKLLSSIYSHLKVCLPRVRVSEAYKEIPVTKEWSFDLYELATLPEELFIKALKKLSEENQEFNLLRIKRLKEARESLQEKSLEEKRDE